MKIQFGALLAVTLVLAGCEAPPKVADTGNKAAVATGDQAQAQAAPKKKCSASTGSRMGNCDGPTPDVLGGSGDDYRRSAGTLNNSTPQSAPF